MSPAKAVLPLAFLLVTPFTANVVNESPCVKDHYLGTYRNGRDWVTISRPQSLDCLESPSSNNIDSGSLISAEARNGEQLVWLEEEAVEPSLKAGTEFKDQLSSVLDIIANTAGQGSEQQVLRKQHAFSSPQLLHATSSAALVSMNAETARIIDTLLPPFWKSTPLPSSPIPFIPVTRESTQHVAQVLSKLKYDSVIASVISDLSVARMWDDIRFLTGEDEASDIWSRHSFTPGAKAAAKWIKQQIEATGASCSLKPFLTGFAPNVVCRYAAIKDTNDTVLFSAHYDSRGSFGEIRAPGADDDGSGTIAILSIARLIKQKKIKFHSNVELVAFAGEEQGLLGSKAYANELRAANASITLMVQADMLGFRVPGEPPQLGLPDRIGSEIVAQLVANVSSIYSPELQVGFTPACCSDHQSFHQQGFPATQVFERAGPIADPMYHNSGDLSSRAGYDFEQIRSIAKVQASSRDTYSASSALTSIVQFATLLHTAGFEF